MKDTREKRRKQGLDELPTESGRGSRGALRGYKTGVSLTTRGA